MSLCEEQNVIELLGNLFAPLFGLLGAGLQFFHGAGLPWWLAIATLTLIVRTVLFPLTIKQTRNMRQLQALKPDLERIQKKHAKTPKSNNRPQWNSMRSGTLVPWEVVSQCWYRCPYSSDSTTR